MGFEPEDKKIQDNSLDIQFEGGGADVDGSDFADAPTVSAPRSRRPVKARAVAQTNFSNDPEERAARRAENHNPPPVRRPMMRPSSEFGYLFSDDEPVDNHMDDQYSRRLDALAYDGRAQSDEQYSALMEGEQQSMVRRPENRMSADSARSQSDEGTGRRRQRFARRERNDTPAQAFADISQTPASELAAREEPPAEPVPAEPAPIAAPFRAPMEEPPAAAGTPPMHPDYRRPRRDPYRDDRYRGRAPYPYEDDRRYAEPPAGYDVPPDAYQPYGPYPGYPPYPYPYGYPSYPGYPPYGQYPGYPPYPPVAYPPYGYPVPAAMYPPGTVPAEPQANLPAEPAPLPAEPVTPIAEPPAPEPEPAPEPVKDEVPDVVLPHPPAPSAGRHSQIINERFASLDDEPATEVRTEPEKKPVEKPAPRSVEADDFPARTSINEDDFPARTTIEPMSESAGNGRFKRRSRSGSGQNQTAEQPPARPAAADSSSPNDWFADSGKPSSPPAGSSGDSDGGASPGGRSSARFNRRSR